MGVSGDSAPLSPSHSLSFRFEIEGGRWDGEGALADPNGHTRGSAGGAYELPTQVLELDFVEMEIETRTGGVARSEDLSRPP